LGSQEKVEQAVQQIATPIAQSLGLEIVQVQYRREGGGLVLRIMIDRIDGGVNVEDCADVSRELSAVLDVEDPVGTPYHLEVTSPGLDRPLVKPSDFVRFQGREIILRTHKPVDGRKSYRGTLDGLDGDLILVTVDGVQYRIQFAAVEKTNLIPLLKELAPAGNS